MNSYAVYCRSITKSFLAGQQNEVIALHGVDLEVKAGELMILAGPSGCGKTTLISVIAGILDQDSGECRVFGTPVNSLPENDRIAFRARHIGFVFQQYNLLPTLSAAENVAIPLIIGGMRRQEAVAAAVGVLQTVGLEGRQDSYPRQLSGGQQQRLAIARAVIHQPRLIVCDEPTSALDGDNGHRVMTILKNLAKDRECALIVVTHDSRIYGFADRIARMEDGRITAVENTPPPDASGMHPGHQ